jgi:hypothetical protein
MLALQTDQHVPLAPAGPRRLRNALACAQQLAIARDLFAESFKTQAIRD